MKHEGPRPASKTKEREKGLAEKKGPNIKKLEDYVRQIAEPLKKLSKMNPRSEAAEKLADEAAVLGEKLLRKSLAEFGIHPQRSIEALKEAQGHFSLETDTLGTYVAPGYTLMNINRLQQIASSHPDAVNYLYGERGIRNFARFDKDFWIRQYEERDSTLPYMVVAVASNLEYEQSTDTAVYTGLQDGLLKLEKPHVMRMVELYSVPELLRQFVRLDDTYNTDGSNPIRFAIFDGHGSAPSILLGKENFTESHIKNERFDEILFEHFQEVFALGATFVFGSCNAAGDPDEEGEVARTFKNAVTKILGNKIRVIASAETVTQFDELTPSLDKNGRLEINIESLPYEEGGIPRYSTI